MHGETVFRTVQGGVRHKGKELTSNIELHIHAPLRNQIKTRVQATKITGVIETISPNPAYSGWIENVTNAPAESKIANKLYTKDQVKFHTILLNALSETLKIVSTLLCMFVGLSMITSAALMATSVPELTDTPVSACVRATMSFVPSPMNITLALRWDPRVELDCPPSWTARTKSAFDLGVHPPMA